MDESEAVTTVPDLRESEPDDTFWAERAREGRLPVFSDVRGSLTDLELDGLGFRVAHAFVVRAPDGAERGGHGHRRTRQAFLAVHGEVRVELRAGGRHREVVLREPEHVLVIAPGVWARQVYRGPSSSLLVFADRPHDHRDYFTDPQDAR